MISIPTTQYDAKLEPLKKAIESGNSDFLRRWLEEGQPICNPESKCDSLLLVAVNNRQFSMLEMLLGAGNWREEYPRELSCALGEAVRSKQIDIVRLLLANGASVESVPWWKIADTHSMEMADVFFRRHKSSEGFADAIDSMEQGFFAAVKVVLPDRPDIEDVLLRAMDGFLQTIHLENVDSDSQRPEDNHSRKKSHAERMFGLMRWTGVDVHKVFTNEDNEKTSIAREAVVYGTTSQLAGLALTEEEIAELAADDKMIYHLDERKVKRLEKLGLPLNSQGNGTSKVLEMAFRDCALDQIISLQASGAKLAEQDVDVLKTFRKRLYDGRRIPKGLAVVLSRILSKDDLFSVLAHPDVFKKFGASARTIVDALNDSKKAVNREAVLERLKELKDKSKDVTWNPRAKEFRIWCHRKFKEPEDERWLQILNREQKQLFDFAGYHGTKETAFWASLLVNEVFPELEKQGVAINFLEQERDRYYYSRNDRKTFCLKMTHLGITASCQLAEITNHPKDYQVSPNDKFAWEFATGRLKISLYAKGVWIRGDIISEKYIFEMLGKGVKVAKKIVDAFADAAAWQKRAAEEEARRIEAQRQREMEEKERRMREQRIREEAERRAAALAAEKAFYEDIVGRGKAVVNHRLARDFIDELAKRWQAEGGLTKGRQEWLDKANAILEKRDPYKVNA